MNIRYGTKDDVVIVASFMVEMWMMHAREESNFINRSVIEKSDGVKHLQPCFDDSKESWLLVAEENRQIIGFVKIDIVEIQEFFNERKVLYLDDLYVLPNFRNRGVAKKPIIEAENIAKEKNVKWLKARVYSFNNKPRQLLKKTGFNALYSEWFKII